MKVRAAGLVLGMISLAVACSDGTGDDDARLPGSSGDDGARGNGTSGGQGASSSGRPAFDAGGSSGANAPAPRIGAMAPVTGDYGAEVTLTGEHLAIAGARLVLETAGGPLEVPFPASGTDASGLVRSWEDTRIVFRYPFPAAGAVGVTTTGGTVQAGAFAPSWVPGPALAVQTPHTQREVLYAGSPSPGVLHVVFDGRSGPRVLVAQAESLDPVGFDRGGFPIIHASLLPTATGGIEGYYASATGGALHHFEFDGAVARVTAAGSASVANGAVGFGRDTTGGYVWGTFSSAGSLEMRRAPDFTTAVRGPYAVASTKTPSIAVHADGAVSYLVGRNDGNIIDDYAYPMLARLTPAGTAFGPSVRTGDGVDDYMSWTRVRGGPGGELHSWYCGKDTEPFDPFHIEGSLDCGEVYVGPGAAVVPRVQGHRERIVAFGPEGSALPTAQVVCVTETRQVESLAPNGERTELLWPCPDLVAGALDASGGLRLLVQANGHLYSPRPAD